MNPLYATALTLGVFGLGAVIVQIADSLANRSIEREIKKNQQHVQQSISQKEQIHEEIAIHWQVELQKVGISTSLPDLVEISKIHLSNDIDYIPFQLFFKREEYQYLLTLLRNGKRFSDEHDGYNGWGVKSDSLQPALYVKRLLNHLEVIKESRKLFGNIDTKESWSRKTVMKWEQLIQEENKVNENILSLIYANDLPDGKSFVLTFTNAGLLSEDERLELVEKKLSASKKTLSQHDFNDSESVTSPALVEIHQFINEHELPDEIKQELDETIASIKEKLTNSVKEKQNEKLAMDAKLLRDTAKNYHQLP
ncbi:hypothetical protein [Rossellomorea marisflavi]|uniref:hypothetical protein n=1 Tax=Rossellomorea marisflavi TaxID=189381 RepID=UPI003FA00EF8